MLKLLVLDDLELRHLAFDFAFGDRHEILHANTADDAIYALTNSKFDIVFLDHSLGTPQTGYDVARFIISLPEDKRPSEVCVHSADVEPAKNMVADLKNAGITAAAVMFGTEKFMTLLGLIKDWE